MFAIYDTAEDDGKGGDKIVAYASTKEEADAYIERRERKAVADTNNWFQQTSDGTWEHMKSYWFSLALDITRFYAEPVKEGGK